MSSKNLHYVFNVEYFQGLGLLGNTDVAADIAERNKQILNFRFPKDTPFEALRSDPRFRSFELYTTYPGLLIGTGYPHDASLKEAIKLGFSLDYVSGLPYLPGSSLKGILRSAFSEQSLIRAYMRPEIHVDELESGIFEQGDVFLGAYPIPEQERPVLDMEYITPHNSRFADPIPVSLMKIRPNVRFVFCFLMEGEIACAGLEERLELYQTLITELGIGAKTRVGFGRMTERPGMRNTLAFDNEALRLVPDDGEDDTSSPVKQALPQVFADGFVLGPCPKCGAEVKRNGATVGCSKQCGMRFKAVMGTEVSDADLSLLLNGGSIKIFVMDNETRTKRPAMIRISNDPKFKTDGKKGERDGIFRPNYVREWLE